MITIFTNPRPFKGPFDAIQRNAIESWKRLVPSCQIILFEDEEGITSKVAKELGVECVIDVKRNEFGTPLLSDVFRRAREMARNKVIAQVNTDIILMKGFLEAVKKVEETTEGRNFFMTGRRWNLNVDGPVKFGEFDWEQKLREKVKKEGKMHGFSGMDYWVFPKTFNFNPPSFNIGRPGMDSWLIYRARAEKVPVIDATLMVDIIHQNHNYPQKKKPFFEVEKKRNIELAGGSLNLMTLLDANWILTPEGLKKPSFPRSVLSHLSLFYPWRIIRAAQRKIRRIIK